MPRLFSFCSVARRPPQGSSARPPQSRGSGLPVLPPFPLRAEASAAPVRGRPQSLVDQTEPPRGMDPGVHHRDVTANLLAARTALLNSGSALPKVVADPRGSMNPSSDRPNLGPARSAANVGLNPLDHVKLVRTNGPGFAENFDQTDPASPAFLAAAAARFTEMSAEELCDALTMIMPNFAACRRHWLLKAYSGANLVLCENPASFMSQLGSKFGLGKTQTESLC